MFHFDRRAHGLADILEQLHKPLGFDGERLSALDALEFDRAKHVAALFVFAHHTAFAGEGACVPSIVAELEAKGEEVPRDAFGHVRLDKVNVGAWFSKQFAALLGAEKTLVQKSGYYSRAAAANAADRKLIQRCAIKAVACAFAGKGGVVGEDEDRGNQLRAIEFERIKGGKPFNIKTKWFVQLLKDIGQPMGAIVEVKH